jgi:hypothetical protein
MSFHLLHLILTVLLWDKEDMFLSSSCPSYLTWSRPSTLDWLDKNADIATQRLYPRVYVCVRVCGLPWVTLGRIQDFWYLAKMFCLKIKSMSFLRLTLLVSWQKIKMNPRWRIQGSNSRASWLFHIPGSLGPRHLLGRACVIGDIHPEHQADKRRAEVSTLESWVPWSSRR